MNLALPHPVSTPAKVGGIFDTIEKYLNLGLQGYSAYQQVAGAGAAGSGGGQAKGLAAITAKSAELLGALDQLYQAAQQNPAQAGAIAQQAEQLAGALSNPQYFYQAKSGQDARILSDAKTAAAQKVAAIRAIASGGAPSQTLITTNTSGQLITTPATVSNLPNNAATSGAPPEFSQYLPYAALALAAFALLKK